MAEDFSHSFSVAKSRVQHGFLLAAVLGLIGLWALLFVEPEVTGGPLLGIFNICLAGAIALYNWRLAWDTRPRLLIDQSGIWFRDWKLDPVPWAQVADSLQKGGRLQAFLCIQLHDPEGLFARQSEDQRAKARSNRLIRPPLLMIPAHSVDADFKTIQATIEDGRARFAQP